MASININISSLDGTLSAAEFKIAACAFSELWEKFNSALPQWSWLPSSKRPGIPFNHVEGYLSMENVILPGFDQVDHHKGHQIEKEEYSCSNVDEFIDDAILVQDYCREVNHYDFHIVYSASYRVPVLYFRAYQSDGQTLVLDEIEKDIPPNSGKLLRESKWTFITQEEHPQLNRPWYTLHPCGTSDWMKLLLTNEASVVQGGVTTEKYLVSWFSVVGQVFGLKIPFEMLDNIGTS
ncbi:ubiquitin-like-conjugating enzyme ATG10 isoform X1 [Olea europaea var. sylvestris]|uniref:ubiquitin-like-conjugating enzyme ATG10 isoform X1 n=1 Tax=Olea europaea var. sylvestris TaxID=158386 RepID=UPI000C1CED83|nr:ubiquitin-like-conjugating enzyme ATG10 isoform X1 [Olea europaea var. sylvestris]